MILRTSAAACARRFLILVFCGIAAVAQARTPGYRLVDLGTLGGVWSFASGLNNRGDVGGYSFPAGNQATHAFIWSNGTMTDLGTPAPTDSVTILDMNDKGDLVGLTYDAAVAYLDGAWVRFPYQGEFRSINKFGDIAGRFGFGNTQHGIVVQNGVTQDLGAFGGTQSVANAINDKRQVVGYFSDNAGFGHAFLWEKGVATDLGTFGSLFAEATDINNRGDVLVVSTPDGFSQFTTHIVSGGVARAIDMGAGKHIGRAMNDRGDVVGILNPGGPQFWRGFVYTDGMLTVLDNLPEVVASGLNQLSPTRINDRGWIVGVAHDRTGEYRAFLLVPR